MGTNIRIAVLHFAHETVTFLANDTTLDDFIYPGSPASGEALLGAYPKSYMGGFVKMAREFDGVELVGSGVDVAGVPRRRMCPRDSWQATAFGHVGRGVRHQHDVGRLFDLWQERRKRRETVVWFTSLRIARV